MTIIVRGDTGYDVFLTPPMIALLIAVSVYAALTGRPEWTLGVYLALPSWARTVLVGGLAQTWILMAATLAALVMYAAKRRRIELITAHDRWIVLWMVSWWAWMLLLYWLFRPGLGMTKIVTPLILYIMFPLPVFLLFADDVRRITGFAVAYIITMILGGVAALNFLDITLAYLLSDPMLSRLNDSGIRQLALTNYHVFAYGFGIALIFSVTLFLVSRWQIARLILLISAACCAYFLFQAGSRQTLGAIGGALALILLWALVYGKSVHWPALAITAALLGIAAYIYQAAPNLIIRTSENNISQAFDLADSRLWLWNISWEAFLSSPVWGTGYEHIIFGHNLLLGTLADQGLVGFVFLLGFLIFLFRQTRNMMDRSQPKARGAWRVACFSIVIFGLIHSQASGGVTSLWYLYWAGAIMWALQRLPQQEIAPLPPAPVLPFARETGAFRLVDEQPGSSSAVS